MLFAGLHFARYFSTGRWFPVFEDVGIIVFAVRFLLFALVWDSQQGSRIIRPSEAG